MNAAGIILAGGEARRMGGGDKSLLRLGEGTILSEVVRRFRAQVHYLALSANGDKDRWHGYGLPVLADQAPLGPLSGILAGMEWAKTLDDDLTHIVSVAADTPFLPGDLVLRMNLAAEASSERIVVAASDGRRHPTCSLWPLTLHEPLRRWLETTETHKVLAFIHRHDFVLAEFSADGGDPFFNVNTPSDLAIARDRTAQKVF